VKEAEEDKTKTEAVAEGNRGGELSWK